MGSFARFTLMPTWLYWINYVCNITYAGKSLAANEFNLSLCTTPAICLQWNVLLNSDLVVAADVWWYFLVMILFFVWFRAWGYFFFYRALAKVT